MSNATNIPPTSSEGSLASCQVRAHALAGALWLLHHSTEVGSVHQSARSFRRDQLSAQRKATIESTIQALRTLVESWPELAAGLFQRGFDLDGGLEPSWWLDAFPRWVIQWAPARAVESFPDPPRTGFEGSNSDQFAELHTLRTACLALIQLRSQAVAFEEAVRQSSRRHIYNFAYGLSHEINNPLANIVSRAERLLSQAKIADDKKSLATIIDQAHRAHEMLAEVMLAVRPPKLYKTRNDICEVARRSVAAWAKLVATEVTVRELIPMEPIYCHCCPSAITEAILCGLQNAFEATGDTGEITISIVDLRPAMNRVRISVSDLGKGMSGSQINNAWDLCYSGREAGRGLGVGLAKLHRIVEGHFGTVRLSSSEQVGTTLEIELAITVD